jgi:tRNA A-37 threonylcarbamoyl transferase component Bud32
MEGLGNTFQSVEENKEQQLASLLVKLPPELRAKWEEKADELPLEEAIQLIENVVSRRKDAKERVFTEIHNIESPELKEEVRHVVHVIEQTFGDANYFVGNGSVAEVYHMPYAPHVCVKYLVSPEKAREHGNNFREETDYLEDLHRFTVEGIRVPDVYFYHMSDFGTCYGMENIDGLSLDRIMEKPDQIDFLEVIKNQNVEDVVNRFREFISAIHLEKKLVHRDLSPRNIMVDREGNWYVIDFGRAKRIEIGDDSTDLSEKSDMAGVENAIRQLYAKIDSI